MIDDTLDKTQQNAPVRDQLAPYRGLDGTCNGCGAMVGNEHEWCRPCAPELYDLEATR